MENKSGIRLGGRFITECYDKEGNFKWVDLTHNLVTDEGNTRILNTMFKGTTQIATWYAGLVESNTTATSTMTYDVPIFTETISYDEVTRPAYVVIAATQSTITNAAAKATFTASATKTIYGAAIFSKNTKGDHPAGADNVLYCYGKFAAERDVVDDDVMNLTYIITSADDAV